MGEEEKEITPSFTTIFTYLFLCSRCEMAMETTLTIKSTTPALRGSIGSETVMPCLLTSHTYRRRVSEGAFNGSEMLFPKRLTTNETFLTE